MICIIPARKGSKRLPNKNKKMLCGKPMIAYTIEAAKKSKYIDIIIVSTDDEDIAKIAKDYKVYDYKRPSELAGDNVPMVEVLRYVIRQLPIGYPKDGRIVELLPTSPLRITKDIDRCIEAYMSSGFSSIITATKSINNSFRMNGSVYVTHVNIIENNDKEWDDNVGIVLMPNERSVDVDTQGDFEMAEMLMEMRNE